MSRLRRLAGRFLGSRTHDVRALDRAGRAVREGQCDVDRLRADATAAGQRLDQLAAHVDGLVRSHQLIADERADFAAIPTARLRSGLVRLQGPPSRRLGTRRHTLGSAVALPVIPWLGVESCVTHSPAIKTLWEQLLTAERSCVDDVLRGEPATVLAIRDCTISGDGKGVHVGFVPPGSNGAIAVPRFTFDLPPRKQRNFGHWLLDCVPQVFVLSQIAPTATFLLPQPYRDVHWSALRLAGVPRHRVSAWQGERVACGQLLVQETDGRVARGRPLPQLLEFRRHVRTSIAPTGVGRRIYVSRRDAKRHRQWMSNHDEVEALFRRFGFEILIMRESSLDEQLQAFRDARVVAGVSGAGLANIVFSDPGTHVITLLTDGLMQWYAEDRGSRSTWARGRLPRGSSLNELSDSPRFYAHLAAVCEQCCHTLICEDHVPVGQLDRFLGQVMSRVDRG